MDSWECSGPVTRSGIVRAKPAVMNEPAGEGLPDGWLKECTPRKNWHSRIKDEMDVYRYLDSGDISQCVMLPRKRKTGDLHIAGDRSRHAGRPSDYTQLHTADESNQYGRPVGDTKLQRDTLSNSESGENAGNMPLPESENINPTQTEADRVDGASKGKSVQSVSISQSPGEAESVTGKGANVEQKPNEKKQKTKSAKPIATPLRSSPRLAALKISQEANNALKDGSISTQTPNTNQLQPKQVKNPRRKTNSSVVPQKKYEAPTASSSEKVDDNHHPSVVSQTQPASVPCSSADLVRQNAPPVAPLLPQQVGLGEAADYMPGSSLSSLFRHVWSDPCLEFAFRILTSDIPLLDDTLGVANYFLPPQNMNKGATPNFSSSAYHSTRNHSPVDHAGLSMPRQSDKLYGRGWFPPH
ncbi:hypothetical protein ACP70R_010963 [Stipagrostis hirtigluma subsp. patula]